MTSPTRRPAAALVWVTVDAHAIAAHPGPTCASGAAGPQTGRGHREHHDTDSVGAAAVRAAVQVLRSRRAAGVVPAGVGGLHQGDGREDELARALLDDPPVLWMGPDRVCVVVDGEELVGLLCSLGATHLLALTDGDSLARSRSSVFPLQLVATESHHGA